MDSFVGAASPRKLYLVLVALMALVSLQQPAGAQRGEVIVITGKEPACADPNTFGVFSSDDSLLCVCNPGFETFPRGGACVRKPDLGSMSEILDEICKLYGCDKWGTGEPPPPPSPCGKTDSEGLTCFERDLQCADRSQKTLLNCKADLNAWTALQCENFNWPPDPGSLLIGGMCSSISALAGDPFKPPTKLSPDCMESCKEKWKDEGNPGITVTLTGVKEVIEIGASVGATPAGTARVSSCNEASLVVFQSCREGLRQSGCANECFAESFSGIQRKLSFYPPIHLPAGRPALAAVRAAQRQSAQEHGINELGHRLLDAGRVADAIVLFRWNAENFPGSANVYASLGAAHAKAGDLVPAIRNYQHALLLDPRKESARSALPELLKRVKSWPK